MRLKAGPLRDVTTPRENCFCGNRLAAFGPAACLGLGERTLRFAGRVPKLPPCDVGSPWMDAIGLSGREKLEAILKEDGRARLICCGHVHHEFELKLGRNPVYTTPSTGIQFHPDSDTPRFDAVAPGCRIIELDDRSYRTHVLRLPKVKYHPRSE